MSRCFRNIFDSNFFLFHVRLRLVRVSKKNSSLSHSSTHSPIDRKRNCLRRVLLTSVKQNEKPINFERFLLFSDIDNNGYLDLKDFEAIAIRTCVSFSYQNEPILAHWLFWTKKYYLLRIFLEKVFWGKF